MTFLCVFVCVYILTYVHTCIRICIHTYIHRYAHTHTHSQTHTYIHAFMHATYIHAYIEQIGGLISKCLLASWRQSFCPRSFDVAAWAEAPRFSWAEPPLFFGQVPQPFSRLLRGFNVLDAFSFTHTTLDTGQDRPHTILAPKFLLPIGLFCGRSCKTARTRLVVQNANSFFVRLILPTQFLGPWVFRRLCLVLRGTLIQQHPQLPPLGARSIFSVLH